MKAVEKTRTVEFEIWTGGNFHKLKSVFGRELWLEDGNLMFKRYVVEIGSFIIKDENEMIYIFNQYEFNNKYDIISKYGSEVKIGRSQPDAIVNINIDAKELAKHLATHKASDAFDNLGIVRKKGR